MTNVTAQGLALFFGVLLCAYHLVAEISALRHFTFGDGGNPNGGSGHLVQEAARALLLLPNHQPQILLMTDSRYYIQL